MRWDLIFFFAGAIMTGLGIKYASEGWLWDAIIAFGIAGMILAILHGVLKALKNDRARKMIVSVGLIVSGLVFVGLGAFQLKPALFGISAPPPSKTLNQDALAHLAALGWTVKPNALSIQFEINNAPMPDMEQSAKYLRQLGHDFNLHFQQVKNLDGLHFLADLPNCTKIEANAGEFTDLSELARFSHLTNLGISQLPLNGPGTVDPSPLASLSNLESLNLGMTKIRTAEFLSKLTKIKTLGLGQTFITDISALSALPLLESLDIRGTRVADLSPLKHSNRLLDISIGGEQIPGLPSLAGLTGLRRVTLIEQRPFDLAPIASLTNLETVFIWGPFVGSLDVLPLQKLTKLRDLTITAGGFNNLTNVRHIESIGVLTELRTLTLGQITITDLNFISPLRNLTQINLNQIPITSIEPLRGLKALKKISFNALAVTDISPLLDLPALTDVTIGRTPARSDVIEELRRRGVNVTTY